VDESRILNQRHGEKSSALGIELAAFASEASGRCRVTIVGRSMRPLIRHGMIAEVQRLDRKPNVGEIVVFRSAAGLLAHRVVAHVAESTYVTCGDACPEFPEVIVHSDILGRATSLWLDDGQGKRRVDGPMLHLAGNFLARTRFARAGLRLFAQAVRLLVRPPGSVPAFRAVLGATIAFERGDLRAGLDRASQVPPDALFATAMQHRMGGLFQRWFSAAAAAGFAVPEDLRSRFQAARWQAAATSTQIAARAREVSDLFASVGIEAVLLKGAARLLADEADADVLTSSDVDVLVPSERADLAVQALREAGYRERAGRNLIRFYKHRVHHRAELWPPAGFVPVEVHIALGVPGSVSAALDFKALAAHIRGVDAPGGPVRVLDDVGSAIHLAYHARDFHNLRDIVLLSRYLRRMSSRQENEFDQLVRRERRDTVRLASAVAVARSFGADTALPKQLAAYVSWVVVREDLPLALRKRAGIIDAVEARSYLYYRGLPYTLSRLHRWAYNLMATPILLRWAGSSMKRFGPGSRLLGGERG
jgi:hypothetical protein